LLSARDGFAQSRDRSRIGRQDLVLEQAETRGGISLESWTSGGGEDLLLDQVHQHFNWIPAKEPFQERLTFRASAFRLFELGLIQRADGRIR
jgi:hypothetical protein